MSDSRRRPSDNEKDNLYSKSLSNNETPAESMNNKRPRPTSPNNCRWDDPIKQFSEKEKVKTEKKSKHRATPNRFNIQPGRQWDGIDRSNGFEVAYFKKLASQSVKKDLDYKYTVADMCTKMEKNELIELVEGPIYKNYNGLLKRKNEESDSVSKEDSRTNEKASSIEEVVGDKRSSSNKYSVPLSEAQRDRRTVFLQQLSVRCTDRDISDFFTENSCPVRNARIVLDKYTRKSKGVAYVEFYEEETVRVALKLGGKKILGVPVIIELTETEKNRIAQEAAALNSIGGASGTSSKGGQNTTASTVGKSDNLVRLYVGSLHSSLTELELERLFEPFGALESVELLREEGTGNSKGVAFIQYKKVGAAHAALEALNGFELAGRAIRVGPVRTETTIKTTTTQQQQQPQTPSNLLPSQQQHQQRVEVDEEENLSLDPRKRAELMQKLLSSRK